MLALCLVFLAGCQGDRPVESELCERTSPITVSREAAATLQNKILANFGSGAPQQFRLTTDSVEVTSYLTVLTAGSNLDSPQVWFTEGHACLTGVLLMIGPLRTTFSIRVAGRIEDEQVHLQIEQLKLGERALPEFLTGMLSRIANETLQDARPDLHITDLEIGPDRLTIAGSRKSNVSRTPWRQTRRGSRGAACVGCMMQVHHNLAQRQTHLLFDDLAGEIDDLASLSRYIHVR